MYSRKQYLQAVQKDYLIAGKLEKQHLLDEAEKRTKLARKYLIRRLSAKTRWQPLTQRQPRSREYGSDLLKPLIRLWDIFDEPCGQRLVSNIKDELTRLRVFEELVITNYQAYQLKKMSPKTIDRLLLHEKSVRLTAQKYRSKNLPLLYQKIPTKVSDAWDRSLLGQIQVDGVEHGGSSSVGDFLVTISTTDIASHWWEGQAVMGKGQARTLKALQRIRRRYPFDWQEIHPDNGTSFINYFLYDYAKRTKLAFSRSRPYQKNDNCFVEQKNSKNVRQVVGYVRYDTVQEQVMVNDLYQNELRLYQNFFQAVMRLETKEQTKGHIHRTYHPAQTPYQYLMHHPNLAQETKDALQDCYDRLNPAELKRTIEAKLKRLAKHQLALARNNDQQVTFSFDPTTVLRLPTLVT